MAKCVLVAVFADDTTQGGVLCCGYRGQIQIVQQGDLRVHGGAISFQCFLCFEDSSFDRFFSDVGALSQVVGIFERA